MKNEVALKPFPENLFNDLEIPMPKEQAEDFLPTLMYILRCVCTPRDSRAVLMRYKDGKTFDEIADALYLSRQRIHYMISDILCRFTGEYREMLSKGIRQYYDELLKNRINEMAPALSEFKIEEIKADAYKEGYEKGYADGVEGLRQSSENAESLDKVSVDSLGLSVRSYNCFKKTGLSTLGDIYTFGDNVMKIEAFGKTSFHEISKILAYYGVNVSRAFPKCVKKWGEQ